MPNPTEELTAQEEECFRSEKNTSTSKNHMLYCIEETPPLIVTFLLGFQQYLMAMGGIVAAPLILANAMCMFETPEGLNARAMVVSTLLFVSGVCTFLQTTFGIRLPIVQGPAAIFIPTTFAILSLPHDICPSPIETSLNSTNGQLFYNDTDGQIIDGTELWQRRMREIQGAMTISALVQVIVGLTGSIGFIMKFVSPLTLGTAIMLIGIGLFELSSALASADWKVSLLTCAVIVICSQYLAEVSVPFISFNVKQRFHLIKVKIFKLLPVLFSIIFGWIVSYILTITENYSDDPTSPEYLARTDARMDVIKNSKWFRMPYPFQWGTIRVSAAGVTGMIAACIGGIIESIGDYHATARMSGAPPPPAHAINRGVAMEGFGCILNGVMGTSAATTSYSQNSAAISITRVGSRSVMQAAGIIMMILGIFGKFGAVLVMIPNSVIGGIFMVTSGMIISVGLSNFNNVDLNLPRNVFTIGISMFMGIMIPEYFKENVSIIDTGVEQLDQIFVVLFQNYLMVGGTLSLFFDATLPGKTKSTANVTKHTSYDHNKIQEKLQLVYDLPLRTNFRFAKYLPFLPAFNSKTTVEGGKTKEVY